MFSPGVHAGSSCQHTRMPPFVILRHDSPRGVHFDLMLEVGDVLKTWALPQPPETGVEMACEALGDHRPAYLDYEGPLSGDRGSVIRWDRGEYTLQHHTEAEWVVHLAGEKFVGEARLCRVTGDSSAARAHRPAAPAAVRPGP
jgi:hypothetical protein